MSISHRFLQVLPAHPSAPHARLALQREVEEYRRQGETWQMEQGVLEARTWQPGTGDINWNWRYLYNG